MRKILFLAVALAVAFSSYTFAGPAGNPSDPTIPHGPGLMGMSPDKIGVLKLSYENDIIFERELDGNLKDSMGGASVKMKVRDTKFKAQYYYGKISYAAFERVEEFVILGACNGVKIDGKTKTTNDDFTLKYKTDFIWGVGGKILVYEWEDWGIKILATGQYRQTEPKLDEFKINGVNVTPDLSKKGKLEIKDWDAGGAISKEFQMGEKIIAVPYVGIKYADSDITYDCTATWDEKINLDTNSRYKVMPYVGLDLIVTDFLSLNVEGRFVSDYALSAGLTLRF
ncbi:MAG: hypothetical protein JW728_01105 [Candidatus Aureabacteria bacterium]|nr:hypothetical protein [Candidatus Auribacterota bacterium]